MKRLLTALLTLIILAIPVSVHAQPISPQSDFKAVYDLKDEQPKAEKPKVAEAKPVVPPKPAPVIYVVVEGDNLTKIGTAYNVEWQRLWAKNTQLTHPDVIQIGDQITVPFPDEVLSRELPAAVSLPKATPNVIPLGTYTDGNTYDYGYCTWYVKNRRGASLPNGLGDAHTWYSRASAMGMAVGSTPRPGAVGTTTAGSLGHVVYVESVNDNGTVNISEMNYVGWGKVSTRTTSASEFLYIY